jgi:hypothetical protein
MEKGLWDIGVEMDLCCSLEGKDLCENIWETGLFYKREMNLEGICPFLPI